jgi:tripartite-type tricarboxylate transporter receptor subunit TctC
MTRDPTRRSRSFRSLCSGSTRRGMAALAVTACFALLVPITACAQSFPSKPITMIIPAPAGGPADVLARLMLEPMKTALGQPVVMENVAGAGGAIGIGRAVRSPPDGYTIVLGNYNANMAIGASYTLQFDLVGDLEPVANLTSSPIWLIGRKDHPAKDMRELIGWLKANPDKGTAAIVGAGTASHVCGVYLQKGTGTTYRFVAYRGGGPAYADVAAGHIDLMCAETSATRTLVEGGTVRAFAVMDAKRWSGAPTVPTIDESGASGLYISFWQGFWVPKGTPKDVIAKLNAAASAALEDPTLKQRLGDIGVYIPPPDKRSPEALAALQKAEIDKWWPIIKAAGIKAEQ